MAFLRKEMPLDKIEYTFYNIYQVSIWKLLKVLVWDGFAVPN